MRNILFQFLLFLLLLIPIQSTAQSSELTFKAYGLDEGLSQEIFYDLTQDKWGFIWSCSENGIERFDGYSFTTYEADPHNPKGMRPGQIYALHADSNGILWVGSHGNGLCRFDPVTETFRYFLPEKDNPSTLSHDHIESLFEAADGSLWAGTWNGLNRIERLPEGNIKCRSFFTESQGSSINKLYSLSEAPSAAIWVASDEGLLFWDPQTQKLSKKWEKPLYSHARDARGRLWLGTQHEGLWVWDPQTESKPQKHPISEALPASTISSLMVDNQNRLWVGTPHGGLVMPALQDTVLPAYTKLKAPDGNKDLPIESMLEDRNGEIWLGINGIGLVQIVTSPYPFFSFERADILGQNATSDGPRSLFQDRPNSLWVGFEENGAIELGLHANKAGDFSFKVQQSYTFPSPFPSGVLAFYKNPDSSILMGTRYHGLVLLKKGDLHYLSPDSSLDPFPRISQIVKSKHEHFWVGTWGGGLYKMEAGSLLQKPRFTHYAHAPDDPESLSSDNIRVLYEDKQGLLWIGTQGGGLSCFDAEKEKFTNYRYEPSKEGGISCKTVLGICEDSAGILWLATVNGLNRLDPETGNFQVLSQTDGLADNNLFAMEMDAHQQLWMSTLKGISSFDLLTGQFRNFDESDGIPGNFYGVSSAKGPDGWMYFGASSGAIVYFHPDSIHFTKAPPIAIFTDFFLFNEKIHPGQEDETGRVILQKNLFELPTLVLEHDQNFFSIGFSGLGFFHPENYRYAYRMIGLKGLEDRWIYVDAQNRQANFNALNPGNYTFEVKAANQEGKWSEEPTALHITLLPPWWQTWWAYVAYTMVALALAFTVVRIFVVRERMRNQMLMKSQEAAQLAELDRMRTRFFANISHEFRTPLTLILGPLEDWIQDPDFPEIFSMPARSMRRNARRLLSLINQLLDLSRLEAGQLQLKPHPGDLAEDLRQMAGAFDSAAEQKQIRFQVEIPPVDIEAVYDRDKLETIVNNLLGNAFKFTRGGGEVRLALELLNRKEAGKSQQPFTVLLSVSDTGPGIPPKKLPHIFERFYQVDDTATRDFEGSGIGLALTKELVEMHGGRIEAESEVGNGTTFRVWLPLEMKLDGPKPKAKVSPFRPEKVREKAGTQLERQALSGESRISVLLLEDNPDLRAYLRQSLSGEYQILEAENGRIGLEIATAQVPDLIISDVMMPEMDGFVFCAAAKTDPRTSHIPVILLTALADRDNRIEGLETGADDYLAKPFDARELRVRVANLIEQRKKLREKYQKQSPLSPQEVAVTSADQRFLEQVSKVLEENYSDPEFTVEAFADAVSLSRMQLHRKLKALTDEPPSELLKQFRLQRAAQLLRQEHASVSEIAFMVGFSSAALFSRSFKELYGVAPSGYKG